MVIFIVIGGLGLLLLLVALPLGDVFELGDGALSGTSLGAGALAFGAIGAIVTANGLPTGWAYVASAVFAVLTVVGVQALIKRLKATEDGQPRTLTGVQGVVTSTVAPGRGGEVSLDDVRELERRLAWADVEIPEGTRIVVVEQSGGRVKVSPAGGPAAPTD
ncbi:NfeD family protein [Actinotalea ferrariae]|uniref:NfeD family protein n=1 Tax=Actinotalea ferrariae TaxID=1386098 RepID=UPI001C8B9618|nr:NfeD family protein [Actinotalea ferrariae]MBX9245346.1 NfeD family protein [Actinotalea ferrariae]